MTVIKYISFALKNLKSSLVQSLLLWLVGFTLSYIFSSVFTNHFSMHMSDSATVLESLASFDFTILSDWKIHYAEFNVFIKLLPVILLLYFLFQSVYSSGIIKQVVDDSVTKKTFFEGVRMFGFKFIGLNTLFLILYLIVLGISLGLYFSSNLNPFETVRDDDWTNRFLLHLIPAIILICLIRNWHQVAKLKLVSDGNSFLNKLLHSFRLSFKRIINLGLIQLVFLLLLAVLIIVENLLKDQLDFTNSISFWLLSLLIQCFVICRITMKLNQFWAINKALD